MRSKHLVPGVCWARSGSVTGREVSVVSSTRCHLLRPVWGVVGSGLGWVCGGAPVLAQLCATRCARRRAAPLPRDYQVRLRLRDRVLRKHGSGGGTRSTRNDAGRTCAPDCGIPQTTSRRRSLPRSRVRRARWETVCALPLVSPQAAKLANRGRAPLRSCWGSE